MAEAQQASPRPSKAPGTPQPRVAWSLIESPRSQHQDRLFRSPSPAWSRAAEDRLLRTPPRAARSPEESLFAPRSPPAAPRRGERSGGDCLFPPALPLESRLPLPPKMQAWELPSMLSLDSPFELRTVPLGGLVEPRLPRRAEDELKEADSDPNLGRFRHDFTEIQHLARGQFSTVYKAQHRTDLQRYAVKVQSTSTGGDRQAAQREVCALAAVANSNVCCANLLRYFAAWKEDDRMHIQLELCESTLRCQMETRARTSPFACFSQEEIRDVVRQVANGLACLHQVGFAHLDVKPDNILYTADGSYKVGDLGLATSLSSANSAVPEGDCRYLARELLQGTFLDLTKADVFSLGLVAYELAISPRELPKNGEAWQALRDGDLAAADVPQLSAEWVSCIRRMVHRLPGERPTCQELAQAQQPPSERTSAEDELQALRRELQEARDAAARSREMAERCKQQALFNVEKEIMVPCVAALGG